MDGKKKTIRFLWATLTGLIILCVIVFSGVTVSVIRQGTSTMNEVATTYMEGMSQQIQNHFDTLVEMRISEIKAITQAVNPETVDELDETAVQRLTSVGSLRGFTHLFLYDTDGNDTTIYGNPVEVENKDDFLSAMNSGKTLVTIGQEEDGSIVLLYGLSVGYPDTVGYPLPNGGRCTALVVGLPIQRLGDALSLGVDTTLIFTHVVRSDGSFVINSAEIPENNIFSWLQNNGKEYGDDKLENELDDMRQAIAGREPYSLATTVLGEIRHFYCAPLLNTE